MSTFTIIPYNLGALSNYLSFLLLILSISTSLSAQFQVSNRLDLYSGINGSFLQPAATVATPYDWDLNVINTGVGFSNDYVFLANASALGLLRDARQDITADVDENTQSWALGDRTYSYDFINDGKPHFGALDLDILGPAFSIQIGEWTRVGAFARLRTHVGARGIDADFSYYPYDELADGSTFTLDETFAAAALWSEYGVHVAQAIPIGNDAELRLGVNARYLLPIDGAYIFNPGGSVYGKLNVDSVSIQGGTTEIGFSNGLRGTEDPGATSGTGFGIDFGAQIAWEPLKSGGYRYTAGLSVIDGGVLNFNKVSERHRFASTDVTFISSEDYRFVDGQEDTDEVLGVLNEQFYGRRGVSLEAEAFEIGLPTAISAQFTVQPVSDLRISAAYVGGVNLNSRQLKAGQQLALAAHFSRWWYGVGLTTAYHDWAYLNMGLQLRLGPLTIGTDRFFGTAAKIKRFQAADFYVGLKFHNFGLKKSDRKSQFNRSRNSRKVKCYEF